MLWCIGSLSETFISLRGNWAATVFGFWMQQMVSLSMSASKVYQPYSKSVVVNQEASADFQIGRKMTSNYVKIF